MNFLRSILGRPPRLVSANVLGQAVVVREGSIRPEPDYDDAWLVACALRSSVVFDVGTNTGQAALEMLIANPAITEMVLIEPNVDALVVAAENLIRNAKALRTRFVAAFASATEGDPIEFWTIGTGSAGSRFRSHARSAAKAGLSRKVPLVTLDRLCESLRVVPDLVKIDVEGAEHEVLLGSAEIARKGQSRMLVEMHALAELPMHENAARVLDWCRSIDYRAWYLKEHAVLEAPEQIAHRGRCHLLLQPSSMTYPEWLTSLPQSAPVTTALGSLQARS